MIIKKQSPEVFCKKGVVKNFAKLTEKHLRQVLFSIMLQAKAYKFIKNKTLAKVLSCEFCEIFKNTFFIELPVNAFDHHKKLSDIFREYCTLNNSTLSRKTSK